MTKTLTRPDVFEFTDFKTFLRESHAYYKQCDSRFSHRFISSKVGAGSAGWFSNVLTGRIALTGTYLVRICKLLKLSLQERSYFEWLVRFEQSGSIDEKNACMEHLVGMKGINSTLISKEKFEFFSRWYIPAVRELLLIYDFRGDFVDLARHLSPPIKPKEAEEAIRVLKLLGFVYKDAQGRLRPNDETILKDPNFATLHWANLMRAKMDLAREAIERYPRNERDISEVYAPLSEGSLQEIKEDIARLRKRILALSKKDMGRDRVWQCNIQLFPISASIKMNGKAEKGMGYRH